MSGDGSAPMSIAERIAALQNKGNGAPTKPAVVTKSKVNNSALAGRIAALKKNVESTNGTSASEGAPKAEKPKVGKLKPPAGAVPIMPFGSGPPPSLLKKQKEREGRMEKLQQEANTSGGDEPRAEKPKVGKLKPPTGAVPIMPFGAGPPPSLLKKQREREERMEKMKQEADSAEDDVGASQKADENVEDALLSRPTIKGGKRRPRTRA